MLDENAAARFELALELADLAEEIMRASLHRRHPHASEQEIEERLAAWYAERPGAEHGDADGIPLDPAKWR